MNKAHTKQGSGEEEVGTKRAPTRSRKNPIVDSENIDDR